MEVKLNSLRDLVKLIIEGTVTFNDDSNAYSLVETMCDTYFEDEQVADYRGHCSADDVEQELECDLGDYEWAEVIFYNFDMHEIKNQLAISDRCCRLYTDDELEHFISEHLSCWRKNAVNALLDKLKN